MRDIKKGMALLEVVISMIITVIVITFVTSYFGTIVKNLKKSNDDFDMQSTMRIFGQSIKKEVINSPTIYLIDNEQFTDAKMNMSPYWNYLGVKEVLINGNESSQLVWYLYDIDTGTHKEIEVTNPVENITYNAVFKKKTNDMNEDEITFKLEGFLDDASGIPNEVIESLITAQNSDQIIDWSRGNAVAIAYRSDELEITGAEGFNEAGMISLVLDASTSMNKDLPGLTHGSVTRNLHRTYLLRDSINKLITSFSNNDNMFFSIVPFSSNGFDVHGKMNPLEKDGYNDSHGIVYRLSDLESSFGKNDLTALYKIFDAENYAEYIFPGANGDRVETMFAALNPSGWTNIGDGLRYAKSFKNSGLNNIKSVLSLSSVNGIKNFIILLTDGEATSYSYKDKSAIILSELYTLEDYDGSQSLTDYTELTRALVYAVEIAKRIRIETPYDDYYFIALSNDVDKSSFYDIAEGFGLNPHDPDFNSTHMFDANTIEELDLAFESIFDDINMNMDYLLGPAR